MEEQLTHDVIGAAIEVHRELGPGLLESVYQACLEHGMSLRGIEFQPRLPLPVVYKGLKLDVKLRLDILIPERLIIELKAVEQIHPVHEAQLLTYMKLTRVKTGLLINFCVPVLKDGIRRRVL